MNYKEHSLECIALYAAETWMLTKEVKYCWKHLKCTPYLKKTVQNCFCQNFVKFPQILIIFDRKIAKRLKLCKVHLCLTSPNLHHHTAVLNADVPNCYTTLKVVICNKLSNDLINTQ